MLIEKFKEYKLPILENGVELPEFDLKPYSKNDINYYEFLLSLSLEGLNKKIGKSNPKYKEYLDRLMKELSIFNEFDFCAYLLITWDIVRFCKEKGIATGFGRGSAAGSLTLYLIGVTEIDSLKYNLFFERFFNRTRVKLKVINGIKYYDGSLLFDIDLDIDYVRRKELVAYLEKKYYGKIAKLPTISTFTTKVLIKEVAKTVLEISEERANDISNSIPVLYGKVHDIDKAIKEDENFAKFAEKNSEIILIAKQLYELVKHFGVHASAWIISANSLTSVSPLQLTKDKKEVISYTMDNALNLAIKIDLLGLRCATLIQEVCNLVGIESNNIDLNDKFIYEQLQDLTIPKGLFQIEADCNYGVLKRVKPKSLEDLSAVVALARPGALQFVDSFSDYIKSGQFQSIHPFFDDILEKTGGVCLYQEQVIKMASKLGFSPEEGETLRRCIGKKKREEMQEWKQKIEIKIKENKLDPKIGEIYWKICDDSASYQFNLSHSLSYGCMAAATIYLKFKYPKEFFLCLLKLAKQESDTISEIKTIENEMKYFGIKLLGPHIIKSGLDFQIEGDNIRFGISSIKGIADKTLEKLKKFCHPFSNKFNIFDAASECGIGISILRWLIHSGCLDDYLTETRSQTALEAAVYNLLTDREKKKIRDDKLGEKFNYNLIAIVKFISDKSKEKPFIKESRLETLRRGFEPFHKIFKQNSKNEELCSYYFESRLLGYCYSHNLIDILKKIYADNIISIYQASTELDDTRVIVGGEIAEVKSGTSKNKNKYIKAKISDGTGAINIMIMGRDFKKNEELNNGVELEAGQIVACEGKKTGDIIFCNKIVNQNLKIFTSASETK